MPVYFHWPMRHPLRRTRWRAARLLWALGLRREQKGTPPGVPHNLLIYAADLDNPVWTRQESVVEEVGNPPPGVPRAFRLKGTSGSRFHNVGQTVLGLPAGIYLASAHVQAAGLRFAYMELCGAGRYCAAAFSLDDGSPAGRYVGPGSVEPLASGATRLDGGWWRIHVLLGTPIEEAIVGMLEQRGDFFEAHPGREGSSILVSGLQLEWVESVRTPTAFVASGATEEFGEDLHRRDAAVVTRQRRDWQGGGRS